MRHLRTSQLSTTTTRPSMCSCMMDRICDCAKFMKTMLRPSKTGAVNMLMEAHEKGEVLTGIFYVDTQ